MITGVGSLPYKYVKSALVYVNLYPVKFLPELTSVDGGMLEWIEHPERLVCLPEFKKHIYGLVKMQCVGPLTLSLNSDYSIDEAVMKVVDCISILTKGLCANQVIFSLDEPGLDKLQVEIDYESLWDAVFEQFPYLVSKIHTCGDADWARLFRSKIEIIGFNASHVDIMPFLESRNGKRMS